LGLENLKSIFAEGVGNNATSPGGRHGTPPDLHPSTHSQLDNFGGDYSPIAEKNSSRIINLSTEYKTGPAFPTNYRALNQIINNEFTAPKVDQLRNHGWPDLYNREHTSKNPKNPGPRSDNPFQPFQYGNPNIAGRLDIRGGDGPKSNLYSFSRNVLLGNKSEPYIVSKIGSSGRRVNQGNRLIPPMRALTDLERIGSYLTSPAGLFELGMKNAHLGIASSVVRDGDKLIKVPQRFNAGYNPLSMLNAVGSRVLGQGVPNYLMKSGLSRGYTEEGGLFDPIPIKGDEPEFKLNDTFTSAGEVSTVTSGFFSLSGEVQKVSTGDKMTLAPMIKGNSLDTVDAVTVGINDGKNQLKFKIEEEKEGMPLYFKDLRDNTYIFFRAFVEGISEDINATWSEHSYIGRSENVYTYEKAMRSITFSLKLIAQTREELTTIYRKMNRLTSLCYPEYAKDDILSDSLSIKDDGGNVLKSRSKTRMKPPLTKFRLGELWGKSNNELLGFVESINYSIPEESNWETEQGSRVPRFVLATITYKVMHGEVPGLFNSNDKEYSFYGINGGETQGVTDV